MSYETLLYEVDQGAATITLNRPAVLNAISQQMIEELQATFDTVKEDASVRAVVLTGAGRGFCSGADLKARQRVKPSEAPTGASPAGAERLRQTLNPLILAIRAIEKPFIAAVNGVAAGAGCNLPRLVGFHKAAELMFTGDIIDAHEAERLGLINRVVPHAELIKQAREFAERLARGPTRAIGLCKRTLNIGITADLAAVLDAEAEGQGLARQTEDHWEGVQAFLEKRPAHFTGT
jgi:2-(1,2-epoxy-1,2-dihydrophenyl)acetyl-CoA isomerase